VTSIALHGFEFIATDKCSFCDRDPETLIPGAEPAQNEWVDKTKKNET